MGEACGSKIFSELKNFQRHVREPSVPHCGVALVVPLLSMTLVACGAAKRGSTILEGGASDAGDLPDAADAGCDLQSTPDLQSCLLNDQYGVFVAPPGSGGVERPSCGTADTPCATINLAVTAASVLGKSRIFVCRGAFTEAVQLEGMSLYGGFDCPSDGGTWTFADASTQLTGPSNQIALTLTDAGAGNVDVDDFVITAPDAVGTDDAGNGNSSIAVLVNGEMVTFRRCVITAGNGANGAAGVTGMNYDGGPAVSGEGPEGGTGGSGGSQLCADGTSSMGGTGGDGAPDGGDAGSAGGDGSASPMSATSPDTNGIGATGGSLTCLHLAFPGASGVAATDPAAAAGEFGFLATRGWMPSSGTSASNGGPGQGGGGGGGLRVFAGAGGSAGGCGGGSGTGGKGGGGSIAVACLSSSATFDSCSFASAAGGNGGMGGDGQPGQAGGSFVPAVCNGAAGGNGAGGSGGAGGTGGISVCVVSQSSTVSGIPICSVGNAGSPGVGGAGQAGGNALGADPGAPGLDGGPGLSGVAQSVLTLP
jgi:hypothetical protein